MAWRDVDPAQIAEIQARMTKRLVDRNLKAEPHKVRDALPVARGKVKRARKVITGAAPYPAVQSPSGEQINVSLPYPPSVNHYWLLNSNGSRRISDEGQAFRASVQARCPSINQITGEVAISIQAYPPDKRRRDLDNILKSLLDALQHAGLIEDDSNVSDLHIRRHPVMAGGAVIVEIRSLAWTNTAQNAQEGRQEVRGATLAGSVANDDWGAL